MKVLWCGILLAAAPTWGAEPVRDPLGMLERPRGADPTARLSPSTQPRGDIAIEEAIRQGLSFLELWQSPNGSWDRLENRDLAIGATDPDWPAWKSSGNAATDMARALAWSSGPFDGPVKDLAENEVEHVADSALAAQSMLRAVTSGRQPQLSKNLRKAIEFTCGQVEKWKGDTIYIQKRLFDPVHDTTPGEGEGRYYDPTVDAFFLFQFLIEAHQVAEDAELRAKVDRAMAIVLDKIERKQSQLGTWVDETDPTVNLQPVAFKGGGFSEEDYYVRPEGKNYRNIIVHCVALKVINAAVRQGVPVKPTIRQKAISFFHQAIPFVPVNEGTDQRKLSPSIARLVLTATYYDLYRTNLFILEDTRKRAAAGDGGAALELRTMERIVADTRADAVKALNAVALDRSLVLVGPALDRMPDLLAAIRDLMPGKAADFENRLRHDLLQRQQSDGHFIAGRGTWGRGDNTFGTATTLAVLMDLVDKKPNTEKP